MKAMLCHAILYYAMPFHAMQKPCQVKPNHAMPAAMIYAFLSVLWNHSHWLILPSANSSIYLPLLNLFLTISLLAYDVHFMLQF